MSISHAEIMYLDSPNKFQTVMIDCIKENIDDNDSIHPKHSNDFNSKKIYFCKYKIPCGMECESGHECLEYYPCFVFHLGESEEDVKQKASKGRHVIPKIPLEEKNSHFVDKEELAECSQTKKHLKQKKEVLRNKRNSAVLQKYNTSQSQRMMDNSDESDNEQTENVKSKHLKRNTQELKLILQNIGENVGQSARVVGLDKNKLAQRKHNLEKDKRNIDESDDEQPENIKSKHLKRSTQELKVTSENVGQSARVIGLDKNKLAQRKHNQEKDKRNSSSHERGFLQSSDHSNFGGLSFQNKSSLNSARESPPINSPRDSPPINSPRDSPPTDSPRSILSRDNSPDDPPKGHSKKWIDKLIVEAAEFYEEGGEGYEDKKKRYGMETGKVYLGQGIEMTPMKWYLLQAEASASRFIRTLSVKIWSPDELMNRAIDITKVRKRNRIPGRSPVKEIERDKLRLLLNLLWDYLETKKKKITITERVATMRKATSHLSMKIRDLVNEELEEAKRRARRRLQF